MTTTEHKAPGAVGTEPEVLVDVQGVKVHFPIKAGVIFDRVIGYVYAVDGVDLTIHKGETYGLVGESGCGKSTLGRAILNLEPPTDGKVIFDGVDIASLKGEALRTKRQDIQMVFQDPLSSLDPRQSVESLLVEGMQAHGLAKNAKEARPRLRELLKAVGLPVQALSKYPHEFSGGQRQRIGIARALAVSPKLVVCDEAVSALDVSIQAQVINLLEDLQEQFKLTYIFIAHDLSVVEHISDRVAVMYLGRIVEIAPRAPFFAQPRHPYAKALLDAVPGLDPRQRRRRELLQGDVPSAAALPSGCRFRTRCPRCADHAEQLHLVLPEQGWGSDNRRSGFHTEHGGSPHSHLSISLAPGSATTVSVTETALSDFFARVLIQEDGDRKSVV